MPIPALHERGFLPAGIHDCTLQEIESRYARDNVRRIHLWDNFKQFLIWVQSVPLIKAIHVDGSFTTDKKVPGDIDVVMQLLEAASKKRTSAQEKHFTALRQRALIKASYEIDALFCFSGNMGNVEYFQTMRTAEAQRRGVLPETRRGILRVTL